MKRIHKYKELRKLKPGEYHKFFILKSIRLPDGDEYFVLVDPYGEKHLLPSKYYLNYPININAYYLCHIDKINCLGQVFIEPEHPFFRPGQIAAFSYGDQVTFQSKKKGPLIFFRMYSETGQVAYLSFDFVKKKNPVGKIRCKITKIRKADLFLEPA